MKKRRFSPASLILFLVAVLGLVGWQQPQYLSRALANTLYAPKGTTPSTSTASTYTAPQTFNTKVNLNNEVTYKGQTIALDGGTHLVDPTLGTDIDLIGASSGTTIQLPASPSDGLRLSFHFEPTSTTQTYTLDANGKTIVDITGSVSTQAVGSSRTIHYRSGVGWGQDGLTLVALANRSNSFASSTTQTFNGGLTANGQVVAKVQAVTLSAGTTDIDLTSGTTVVVTGSTGGATLRLPGASSGTPPTAGTLVLFANQASVSWTLSANGSNVDGGSTVSVSNSRAMVYSGSAGWTALHLTQAQATLLFGSLTGNNTWTGSNTWNGSTVYGRQTFSASGSISATGSPLAEFTGSTGQTITLPGASAGLWFTFWNSSANTVTFSASPNSFTDLAASTISVPTLGSVTVVSDSGGWHTLSPGIGYANATYGRLGSTNTWTAQQNVSGTLNSTGQFTQSGRWSLSSQTIATTGGTLTALSASATSAYLIILTGSSSGTTLPMPGTPNANQTFTIKNASSVTVTISGNGVNIEAAGTPGSYGSSTTLTAGQSRTWRYDGSQYSIIAAYG